MNALDFCFNKKELTGSVPSPGHFTFPDFNNIPDIPVLSHADVPVFSRTSAVPDFVDIPEAPVASDNPLLSSSQLNGPFIDFQLSQVFLSQKPKKWKPPYTEKPQDVALKHSKRDFRGSSRSSVESSQDISDILYQDKLNSYNRSTNTRTDLLSYQPPNIDVADDDDEDDGDTVTYRVLDDLPANELEIDKRTSYVPPQITPLISQCGSHGDSFRKSKALDSLYTPASRIAPESHGIKLISIEEIPVDYRSIFPYQYFNTVQSRVFQDIFYSDKPVVVSAPTGSGKTVVFELAIIRLLMKLEKEVNRKFKIVYMAPIKALCNERYLDWKKFEKFGVKLLELTGDTELSEYDELQEANIILTTPEKWDSTTRRWRDNKFAVQSVCLFLIDEIHVLNDNTRGATIEAVISRMKTIQAALSRSSTENFLPKLRFVAVSATLPNIEDIAEWLGDTSPALYFKLDESLRPVRLRKVVLGFPFDQQKGSDFQFDMSLNYKLAGIINTYSDDKPTLVFCSTRKSTQQAAELLAKDARGTYIKNVQAKQILQKNSNMLKDSKLRDLLVKGIGYHHAGLDLHDRKIIEEVFYNGQLQVLVATSTLAMGVNLPAHLVILKSTQYYNMGVHEEYSDTQVLQMIGRAGRPQFDTSATAVIMTKIQTKMKYESLLNGTQLIESSLHKNLIEHLNAEIVLHTINDISIAMEWIRYTFLYIRVLKNPKHYGMPTGLNKEQVERRLQDLCMKNLNQLAGINLISMDDETFDVKPTEAGRLMARYCIAYETMKKFCKLSATESICDLIYVLSDSEEFTEISLRNNEKKTLNTLNKDKNRMTIRYPLQGKIKTKQMKVNCLIQSQLGCLLVQDFSLQQDTTRIFRVAQRIARGLVEMLWLKDDYKTLHNAVLLCKSLKTRLWEDSKHVTKQLDRIGPALSNALVNAGIISFQKIEETNPRELELIVNRHPPFGNQIRDIVAGLPKYELTIEQIAKYSNGVAEITISLNLANQDQLLEKKTTSPYHTSILMIGDEDNKVIYKRKIMDSFLMKENGFTKKLEIRRATTGEDLYIDFISQDWVGLDVQSTYRPFYLGPKKISSHTGPSNLTSNKEPNLRQAQNNSRRQDNIEPKSSCNHRCLNKQMCAHECCRTGVTKKSAKTPVNKTPVVKDTRMLNSHLSSLKTKSRMLPETPSAKMFKPNDYRNLDLQQFAYSPYTKEVMTYSPYMTTDDMTSFTEQQPCNEEPLSLQKLQHQRVGNYTPQHRMDSSSPRLQHERVGNYTPQHRMDSSSPKLQHERVGNYTPQHRMDSSSPKLQHQRVGNHSPQHRMDSTTMQQQDCSIPVQDRNREVNHIISTSHGGWTELDMYQKQREEYIDDDDMLDIDTDSSPYYQDKNDTYYNDRNDNQQTEADMYGNFDIGSSFSAVVPTQTPYNRQNYPSPYHTDSLYNRHCDRPAQDPGLTNRKSLYQVQRTAQDPELTNRNNLYKGQRAAQEPELANSNTIYKGQRSSLTSQYGSNMPSERLQTRNVLSNNTYTTKYQLPSQYKDCTSDRSKGDNLLYRTPANTNVNPKGIIDQNHRFGQVVAWTNSQNKTSSPNSGSEWSGSDNDLLTIDDKTTSSCKENCGSSNSKSLEQKGRHSGIQESLKPGINQHLHTVPTNTSKSNHQQQVLKEIHPSQKSLLKNTFKPESEPTPSVLKEIQVRKIDDQQQQQQRIPAISCLKKINQKPKSSFKFFARKDQDFSAATEDEQDRFNSIFDGIF